LLPPIEFHRPPTVDDAVFVALGTELLQVMKLGLARFDHLIDLTAIGELQGIRARAA
jgi:CO/xanthine dehydrogenase FAD-binding subunit